MGARGLSSAQRKHDDAYIEPSYKEFLRRLNEGWKPDVSKLSNGDHGLPASEEEDGVGSEKSCFGGRGECSRRQKSEKECLASNSLVALGHAPHNQFKGEASIQDESYARFQRLRRSDDHSKIPNQDSCICISDEEEKERSSATESLSHGRIENSKKQQNGPCKKRQASGLPVREDVKSSMISPMSRSKKNGCKGSSSEQREHDDAYIEPSYSEFLRRLNEGWKPDVSKLSNGDHGLPASEEDGVVSGKSCFGGRGECSRRRQKSEKECLASNSLVALGHAPQNQFKGEASIQDESYARFQGLLRSDDHSRILNHDSCICISDEEEKERSSAAESLSHRRIENSKKQQNGPCKKRQASGLPVPEDVKSSMISSGCLDSSDFKKKLMIILNRAYDQTEYEDLLKKACERKPQYKLRLLRNTSKTYATKKDAFSYFDHYPDLSRQISAADCHTRLKLLRGFFFWLENLCHEGAFKPWVSPMK